MMDGGTCHSDVSDHESFEFHITNLYKWKTLEARLIQNKIIDAAHLDIMEKERNKFGLGEFAF